MPDLPLSPFPAPAPMRNGKCQLLTEKCPRIRDLTRWDDDAVQTSEGRRSGRRLARGIELLTNTVGPA
jgi:hypothetical protein